MIVLACKVLVLVLVVESLVLVLVLVLVTKYLLPRRKFSYVVETLQVYQLASQNQKKIRSALQQINRYLEMDDDDDDCLAFVTKKSARKLRES